MSEEEINHTDENTNLKTNQKILVNSKINKNYKNIKFSDSLENKEESEMHNKKDKNNKNQTNTKIKENNSNMKVFEKYHNLSIKELHILLSQKNDDLIKLNEEKEKSKKILNDLITKLNKTISSNSDYLYDEEQDADLILNLDKIIEGKKKQLENSKKMNSLYKEQLSKIKSKIFYNEKEKKKLSLIDNKIDNLKKKNKILKKEINEIKNKNVIQDKELEIIADNKKYPLKIKIKTEEMNNYSSQKHDYFEKLSMTMKSLDNVIKEIKRFDEMYNSSIKEDTDENLVKKINFWMNLIKSDLSGEKNEIVSRVEAGKSQFLNEIKNRNEANLNTIKDETISFANNTNNSNTEETPPKKVNTENDINKNNDKIIKNKIIINKNKSSSLLYSNIYKSANGTKRNKIPSLYINSNNSESNLENKKTLFKKLNYLKVKSPGMKLKLKGIRNIENNHKGNNYFISEEINESAEIINDNMNYIETNSKRNINLITNNNQNSNNKELNNILSGDYNEINDAEYRELLSKKEQYLESNLRLEKNIIEIKRTKNKKLLDVLKIIKENANNLENIKIQNNLIEKEISNLYNVFQLTIEQTKLKNEINQKSNNKKKLKIKKESDDNKLIKSNDKILKNQNFEDIPIPKKRKLKTIETNNTKKKKKKENREEQLKMIKEKYRNGTNILNDEDNHIKEIEKDNEYEEDFINNNNIRNLSENKENKENNNEINNEEINNIEEEKIKEDENNEKEMI